MAIEYRGPKWKAKEHAQRPGKYVASIEQRIGVANHATVPGGWLVTLSWEAALTTIFLPDADHTLDIGRLNLEWEAISSPRRLMRIGGTIFSGLIRAKIDGGWIAAFCWDSGWSATFFPDPEHSWEGASLAESVHG